MTFSEIQQILKDKTVGIAGCGGLGSNCAVSLARVGVGTLILVDFDVISESNLNRQYYFYDQIGSRKVHTLALNIHRINPSIKVISHDIILDSGNIPFIFRDCNVIVEAFDQASNKKMLIETILTEIPEKPLVIGVGMAGWGKNELIHFRRSDSLYICGDEVSEIADDNPPMGPRVGIVANMQANVVMEILLSGEVVR